MKKFLAVSGILLLIFGLSCKRDSSPENSFEDLPLGEDEIDIEKIENITGFQLRILLAEELGFKPLNKFYWISVKEKIDKQKVEELAIAIIKETITQKPETYHTFTIHFYREDHLSSSIEKSRSFAHVTFLPKGGWLEAGQVPIDNYESYELTCTILE